MCEVMYHVITQKIVETIRSGKYRCLYRTEKEYLSDLESCADILVEIGYTCIIRVEETVILDITWDSL